MLSSVAITEDANHIRLLRGLAGLSWIATAVLAHSSPLSSAFDSSFRVVQGPSNVSVAHRLGQPALRWDTFHFAHIAQYGYVYEHERAFMPGSPMVMRAMLGLMRVLGISSSEDLTEFGELLLGAILVAFTCNLLAVTCLYRLTIHHLQCPTIALLVSLLSLLPSSPATLRIVPYTEPFFTYLSYQGE